MNRPPPHARTAPPAPLIGRRPLLLAAAGAWGAAGLGMPAARAADEAVGAPLRPRPLVFPRDHGTHNHARTEWWYLTGQAQDERGALLGFQVTFFRSRVDPAQRLPGRLAARHLLFAHAAITDVAGAALHHDERLARWNGEPPPVAGQGVYAAEADTDVTLRDWHIRRGPDGLYDTRIEGDSLGIALRAAPVQTWLLQGEHGFSRKGPDPAQASFYVTHPQLAVDGTLRLRERRWRVRGTAWLDHEWSEAILHPEAVGWDWVGMNLDDGGALTAFRLRRADGSALWAGGSFRPASAGGDPLGARAFGPHEVRFTPERVWVSPKTGARYPVVWRLQTPAGEHRVQALVDAQELDSRASTGTVYWEGLSDLHDAAGRRVGRGYLEMTGYAARLVL